MDQNKQTYYVLCPLSYVELRVGHIGRSKSTLNAKGMGYILRLYGKMERVKNKQTGLNAKVSDRRERNILKENE